MKPETLREEIRRIILAEGRNSASYQLVNEVITKWTNASKNALVGYVPRRHIDVLAGEPVCAPGQTATTIDEFRTHRNRPMCVFAAESPRIPGLIGESIQIGQQPVWNPQTWQDKVLADPRLREQFNRARNKGITIKRWSPEKATADPGLQLVLDTWLQTRPLPPLHFLVEPQTLGFLQDRLTFVALQRGHPVAFLNLCPVPRRNGWLTEQFPRLPNAPNGTVEALMHHAALHLAERGDKFLTMGMVPLTPGTVTQTRGVVRSTLAWVRAHGRRFYNFEGLHRFKSKFHPDAWEPLYIVADQGPVRLRHLVACAEAFTGSSITSSVPRIVARAIQQEARWVTRRS